MVSSLIHVLIVTPVIFFWLRERQFGLARQELPDASQRLPLRRLVTFALIGAVLVVGGFTAWRLSSRGGRGPSTAVRDSNIVQTVRSGDLEIVLLSPNRALRQGRSSFTIEFRRGNRNALVDVGTVRASANMTMPGMVMSSGLQVTPSGVPGRYAATADFGMAGGWQMAIEWNGPAGQGSVTFQGNVQ
jgi:hypothetical protein